MSNKYMTVAQALTLFGLFCLGTIPLLARQHLRQRRGLRLIFGGLLVGALGGVVISFSSSLILAKSSTAIMLLAMVFVVWGIHVEKKIVT